MIQRMLAIWSLVPLLFLSPAWTSGSSWFTYCWSLAWRILSITLLLEGLAIPFSRGFSWPRVQTLISCIAGILYPLSHQGSPAARYVRGQNWKLLEWECDLGQDTLLCFLFICKSRNHNSTLFFFNSTLLSSLFIRVALMVKQWLVYSNWHVSIIKMKQRFCCLSFLLQLEHILLLFRTIWGKLTKEKNPCLYCLSPHQSKSIH